MGNQQTCQQCGAQNSLHHTFCFQCGASLATQASPTPAMPTGLLKATHLLKHRYLIKGMVGQGGMGAVYEAEDLNLGNRRVAVKEMSQHGLSPQEQAEAANNFKREAHLLADLSHPSLPSVYDHFFQAGRWYLVMSFIAGETLATYSKQFPQGILPIEEVLAMGIQLCSVLSYLHAQQPPIIFRDLKPPNIMRTADGHLYLIDFGIARHFKTGQAKDTQAFISWGYAAPEQYGKAQTTARSDIYSLGATLHQWLSGQKPADTPFRFVPLSQKHPRETALAALITQMVEMDEGKRPANMALVKQHLQQIAAMQDVPQQVPSIPPTLKASMLIDAPLPTVRIPESTPASSFGTLLCTIQPTSSLLRSERAVSWLTDGSRIATASSNGTIQFWDAKTGQSLKNAALPTSTVTSVAWSPDSNRIAFISRAEMQAIQVWDILGEQPITTYQSTSQFEKSSTKMAWSSNSIWIASILTGRGETRQAVVWDTSTGQEIIRLQVFGSMSDFHTCKLQWSSDCVHLACAASGTWTVKILDTAGRSTKKTDNIYCDDLAWSPDGICIAISGRRGILGQKNGIHTWDVTSGILRTIHHDDRDRKLFGALMWSPERTRIAMKAQHGQKNEEIIHVCDVKTGALLSTCDATHPTGSVASILWSPDGTRIAVQLHDRVQVWQII